MKELIFDAGPLITSCRFAVAGQVIVDYLLEVCRITIAASVRDEVVVAGQRYADARVAQERISQANIIVMNPPAVSELEAVLAVYSLGQGEHDSILLTQHSELRDATLAVDDHLAYLVSDRLGIRKRFLLDIVADLAKDGAFDRQLAVAIVETIRSRYPKSFVEHTLLLLER